MRWLLALTAIAIGLLGSSQAFAQDGSIAALQDRAEAALARAEAALDGYERALRAALAATPNQAFADFGAVSPPEPTLDEMLGFMASDYAAPDVGLEPLAALAAEIAAVVAVGGGPNDVGGEFGGEGAVRQAERRAALLEEAFGGRLPQLRAEAHALYSEMLFLSVRARTALGSEENVRWRDAFHERTPALSQAHFDLWIDIEACATRLIADWREPPAFVPGPSLTVERFDGHRPIPSGAFVYEGPGAVDAAYDAGVGFLTVLRIAATDDRFVVHARSEGGAALTYVATVEGVDDLAFADALQRALQAEPPEIPEAEYCAFCLAWTDPEEPRHTANASIVSETFRYGEDVGMRRFDGRPPPSGAMASRVDGLTWDVQRSWEYVCYERAVAFRERVHVSMSSFGGDVVIQAALPLGATLSSTPMPDHCVSPPEGALYGED